MRVHARELKHTHKHIPPSLTTILKWKQASCAILRKRGVFATPPIFPQDAHHMNVHLKQM